MTRMPARVLLLTTDYPPVPGGVGRLLHNLVTSTADSVEWRVLTSAPGPSDTHVIRAANARALWSSLPTQIRWLQSVDRRAVVCGHVYSIVPALCAARLAGAQLGTVVHGMELVPRRLAHRLVLLALRGSDQVVAVSQNSAEITRRLGVRADRICVMNPSLDPPWALPAAPSSRPAGQGLRLITVSRLAEGYKNIDFVLRILSVIARTETVSRLTIIGDGPRRRLLEERARALGIEALTKFVGRVDDKAMGALLTNADLGLFPSRDSLAEGGFEGFGLVIQEMGSTGLPVLVGRAAGAIDAAGPGWSLLLDPDDLRLWINTILRLAGDEAERLRMSESALAWAHGADHRKAAKRFMEALAQ